MAGRGERQGRLTSTRTALRFYQSAGWVADADGSAGGGIPMTKALPTVRRLGASDAAAYREIRLESLRDAPDAYGSVYADWADAPMQTFADRRQSAFVVGAFDNGALVGLAVMDREKGGNTRHRALLTAVYVRPAARGKGLTMAMMEAIAAHAVAEGILQLELHVVVTNAAAIRAYEAAGFERAGLCPRAIMSRGRFADELLMVRRLDA